MTDPTSAAEASAPTSAAAPEALAWTQPLAGLGADDFTLLGLPERFALDRAALDTRWRELQRLAHPDRFAAQGAAAQRVGLQWSVRLNEAYQRLKDPLKRAIYLCERRGAPVQAESNTAMPRAFLLQQMAWREALDDAQSLADFEEIERQCTSSLRELLQKTEQALDVDGDAVQAAGQVRAWMFVARFADELRSRMERCAD